MFSCVRSALIGRLRTRLRRDVAVGSALGAAQVAIRGLHVERQRVVHGGRNAALVQGCLHDVAVVDHARCTAPTRSRGRAARLSGCDVRAALVESARVLGADFLPASDFPVESLQLGQHDGALQRVHASADTDAHMVVALLLTVHANLPQRGRQVRRRR